MTTVRTVWQPERCLRCPRPRWGSALVLALLAATAFGQEEEQEARQAAVANWQHAVVPLVDQIAVMAAAAITRDASCQRTCWTLPGVNSKMTWSALTFVCDGGRTHKDGGTTCKSKN